MNRISLAAMAAALAAVLIGGALILSRGSLPDVGTPSPSPSSTATPAPTLLNIVPAAEALWGDWVADPGPLGLRNQGPRIQMSLNYGDARELWIQTNYNDGTQVFDSDSIEAPVGELRLIARQTLDGCTKGDLGTYGYSRPGDGLFMTLMVIADDCAARAVTLGRTWVHTLSAVTSGGHGVLPVTNLELTLPDRKFGLSGYGPAADDDTTWDSTPYIEFLSLRDPPRFLDPCSASDPKPTPGTAKAADAVAYVRGLPGFTFTSAATTIDGHPATHLTGTPRSGFTCAAGDIGLFPYMTGSGDDWTLAPGTPLSVWITETGGHAWLFWYHGDEVTAADEAAVIGSIHFITALPTP